MQDEDTRRSDQASAETDEALSRAAREAVRQPADPRLEKSFARLGLFADDDSPASPPRPGEPVPAPGPGPSPAPAPAPARPVPAGPMVGAVAPAVDLEPLRADVVGLQSTAEALRATVDRLEQRLTTVTILLGALLVGLVAVAILVLVR